MHDRGDKIVTLAHELLRYEAANDSEDTPAHIALSFKALCFTTLITAFGSWAVTTWANETQRPLNRYERTELEALIYYAAHQTGVTESDLRQDIRDKLGVADLNDLTEGDFIMARRYLQNVAAKNLPES